jgi:hypothetical protein
MNCLKPLNKMAILFSKVYGRTNLRQKRLRQVSSFPTGFDTAQ